MSEIKDKNYADVSGDKQGRKLIEDKKMSKGKIYTELNLMLFVIFSTFLQVVYNQSHYFGFRPIYKPKPKLADTFDRYRNQYRNYILKGESS